MLVVSIYMKAFAFVLIDTNPMYNMTYVYLQHI